MDFTKYKSSFGRLVNRGQRARHDIYQNLWENKDNATPLMSSHEPTHSANRPLAPVPLTSEELKEIEAEVAVSDQEQNVKMQQEARILRDVLLPNVSEATIYDLLQRYTTAELALNAYYENHMVERV